MNWIKLLSVFSITTLIFLTGFLVGDYMNEIRENSIKDVRDEIFAEVASTEAQYALMADDPCSVNLQDFSKLTDSMGAKLKAAEDKLGWEEIESLKAYYFAVEVKHYLLTQKINEQCGGTYKPIFYFYSNKRCAHCLEQGTILSELKQQNPNVMIYSFDAYNPSPLITTLNNKYYIKDTLPVTIAGEKRFEGLTNKEMLLKEL